MKKRVLLQTAVLLAATVNLSEVAASCFPAPKGQTPLDVLKCLQSELDSQQKRIAELEKENERLRHAISVSRSSVFNVVPLVDIQAYLPACQIGNAITHLYCITGCNRWCKQSQGYSGGTLVEVGRAELGCVCLP